MFFFYKFKKIYIFNFLQTFKIELFFVNGFLPKSSKITLIFR